MAVNPPVLNPPLPVPGFKVGTASCGVKSPALKGKRQDVTLIVGDVDCHAAGVFTSNRFRAACVRWGEKTLTTHAEKIRAIVANAGNANAGLGEMENVWARQLIESGASAAGVDADCVLSSSTGVIGTPFPIDRVREGMHEAATSLTADNWEASAHAIRTTDTFAKWSSAQIDIDGNTYTLTGICKGSGMIHPNMATMLGFVATDAPIAASDLAPMLKRVANRSFNCISVDGDTSTNDTLYLLSSGIGLGHTPLADTSLFEQALTELCIELAQLIVRDGEGVSKFVTIEVNGAASEADARTVGRAVAISPLVKTAFAGSDANWGRILSAVGNSGIAIDTNKITLSADDVLMFEKGNLHPDYRDADGMEVFRKPEFTITLDLGMGSASSTVWTGDLTHDYITINAEYRT
ncbi:MAG: bifunctional glutamate N-acetyltransferase/amino-acid acetyltransferase ArgJ [Zetaproteobacteria bacterium CG12_big_fil_rev_8_21_14_0_65_55_1124]|nr:MAG: bifunctional ornithine acetyltransferase/N-acetylglutamate synthase [Zetaproteobacteria bacterium CG1_02_55_237]PIS18337.1 MAG: bifunctional glutamate N-acetyltransferase/amino-acid acetyltransferase ArgJ [Zetaproteobacteria bacterium CG08_land_8_20_14_0_20_55_17]PIW43070.1 MAG: bifunctional glutamate N-acetyltransferase/amino-acid acetyltransferase ArgJ [Zetaproteobacteria bacterium CG12_big_fil_rev_8_21_14_0_65_55_1124]PIY52277.1 MAG: bifunctional glutamate N-acetyltransferase/amino-ac